MEDQSDAGLLGVENFPKEAVFIGPYVTKWSPPPKRALAGYIYFLIKDGRIDYVGKSININGRLSEHLKWSEFDEAFYFQVPPPFGLGEIETAFIQTINPKSNASRGLAHVVPEEMMAMFKQFIESGGLLHAKQY